MKIYNEQIRPGVAVMNGYGSSTDGTVFKKNTFRSSLHQWLWLSSDCIVPKEQIRPGVAFMNGYGYQLIA